MMRTLMLIVGTVFLSLWIAPEAAVAGNEEDCQEWCAANPQCDRCSALLGCGPGYRRIRSFRGPGKNWYACAGLGGAMEEASRNNQQECESWCAENEECAKCSELLTCGPGYRRIRSWTGRGKNWHACAEQEDASEAASQNNQQECESWCAENEECDRCSALLACGPGYRRIRSFRGPGKNWYACAGQGGAMEEASRNNQQECESWCAENDECAKCSELLTCGPGYRRIRSWTGRGKNWHACAEQEDASEAASQNNQQECESWCAENDECDRCSALLACGPGYRRIRSFSGPGKNWYACAGQGGAMEEASRDNQQECESWCAENDECVKCSEIRTCGPGYRRIRSWTGRGKNWHACAER